MFHLAANIPILPLIAFLVFVAAMLALDLGVLNRKSHVVSAREALKWTAFWVAMALLFSGGVYIGYENHWMDLGLEDPYARTGRDAFIQFITGYVVEQSLSLDNIFVIATIFSYMRVPAQYQHRVLFWGIIGVVVLRGAMIATGAVLINAFEWTVYLFGALLIYSAIKMLALKEGGIDLEANRTVKLLRRIVPISSEYDGERFLTRVDGRLMATPLLLVLCMVESADVVFAVDSIPAIFGITKDPLIVFTSNIFAILGLRSLYFALAAVIAKFRYLKVSLAFVLGFVGAKMILAHHYPIDPMVSLGMIAVILLMGIVASIQAQRGDARRATRRLRAERSDAET